MGITLEKSGLNMVGKVKRVYYVCEMLTRPMLFEGTAKSSPADTKRKKI